MRTKAVKEFDRIKICTAGCLNCGHNLIELGDARVKSASELFKVLVIIRMEVFCMYALFDNGTVTLKGLLYIYICGKFTFKVFSFC